MATKKLAKKKSKPLANAPHAGPSNPPPASAGSIRIRMYNVGFGDCFLITIPGQPKDRRILIDCGTVSAGPQPMSDIVAKVIQDCADSDGKSRIDVVVATHRHKDHVSGFADASWKNVEVSEVWMPWTEDRTDPAAKRIRDVQSKLALALRERFAQFKATPATSPLDLARVEQLDGLMLNALSNEKAMDTLHGGFGGESKLRFMPREDDKQMSFETGALPGVTIFVLGPSHDPEVIRDMDPPSGKSYLRIADGLALDGLPEPFRPAWHVPENAYAEMFAGLPASDLNFEDKLRLQQLGSDMELTVASALDKAVNGTSLMLVLKVGATHLLFPGDAQWGTWQAALKNPEARALMQKAKFYKIGHHGSHNATPKEFVDEIMGDEILSMVSTKPGTYNNVPRGPLLEALASHHAHIARSDKLDEVPAGFIVEGELCADLTIPIT